MTVDNPEMPATTTTPSSPPPLTAQQIESYLASIQSTYRAAQAHPRYRLRYVGLCAIAGGVVLNIVSSIVAFSSHPNAPRWVVFWAGVVYTSSLLYQLLDLACHPHPSPRAPSSSSSSSLPTTTKSSPPSPLSSLLNHHIPTPFLLPLDTAAFLAFLALLIANGIVVSDLNRYEVKQIYVYNSVAWMVCCAVHGIVAVRAVPSALAGVANSKWERVYCCKECERESKRRHGKGEDEEREGQGEAGRRLLGDVESGEGMV